MKLLNKSLVVSKICIIFANKKQYIIKKMSNMKKFLIFSLLALCMSVVVGCSSCKKDNKEAVTTDLNVENVTNTDKQYMFTTYGEDYRWFETCILLSDWLDSENFDGSIEGISNVFQVVAEKDSSSYDTFVVLAAHTKDAVTYDVKKGFWVEDYPLIGDSIKLTYKDAFNRVMETNSPKPHTKNCVLRKPVGPAECNPQYVFGNIRVQLWVDAVTGEVKNSNPAFPEEKGFKMPLGEWP